ncbi:LysR family transcriptional regulator [Vibrio sp.]|uniref:LysR family transcriptional regulator n=1 Tax=Vibrio sp. TaxID=678 RepID=UPI003AA998AD
MTFSQLNIFSILANCSSFTSASQQLNISQSGVSHAIKTLEDELGVKLFLRNQNRIELTYVGMRLLERARAILSLEATMRQEATGVKQMKQGTVKIGAFESGSIIHILPNILEAYRKKYPNIDIFVEEGANKQIHQWLIERRIDIGIMQLPQPEYDSFHLLTDKLVALVPKQHPLAKGSEVCLKALCKEPMVLVDVGFPELITQLLSSQNLKPQIQYHTSQLISALDIVAREEAVSIVATSDLPKSMMIGVTAKPLAPTLKRQIGMVVLNKQYTSPAVKALLTLTQKMKFE